MKYIKGYSNKINESIGNGSVLLIKGKPTDRGTFLYVTTIRGYVEIKPGVKMVFIDDTIWRVKYKGDNKFVGVKVDYRGEASLRGVFNMKQRGTPSLVLNHKKTPFHWITLKHTDIGAALRELGQKLWTQGVILESNNTGVDDFVLLGEWVTKEFIKYIKKEESALGVFKILDKANNPDDNRFEEDSSTLIWESELCLDVFIKDNSLIPENLINAAKEYGYWNEFEEAFGNEFVDFARLEPNTFTLCLFLETEYSYIPRLKYERGGQTFSYSEHIIINNYTYVISIVVGPDDINLDSDRIKNEIASLNEYIKSEEPFYITLAVKNRIKENS